MYTGVNTFSQVLNNGFLLSNTPSEWIFIKLCSYTSSTKTNSTEKELGLMMHRAHRLAQDLWAALLGTLKSPAGRRWGAQGVPQQPCHFHFFSNLDPALSWAKEDRKTEKSRLLTGAGKETTTPAESSQSLHNPQQIKEISCNPSLGHQHSHAQKRQ